MKGVENAARVELLGLPEVLRGSTLAASVLELAARLDAEPSDREAAQLARELRLTLGDLHRRAGLDPGEEVVNVGAAEMGD